MPFRAKLSMGCKDRRKVFELRFDEEVVESELIEILKKKLISRASFQCTARVIPLYNRLAQSVWHYWL